MKIYQKFKHFIINKKEGKEENVKRKINLLDRKIVEHKYFQSTTLHEILCFFILFYR